MKMQEVISALHVYTYHVHEALFKKLKVRESYMS